MLLKIYSDLFLLLDSVLLLIIVCCSCAFVLFVIVFLCVLLIRRKRCHAAASYKDFKQHYDPPVEEKKGDGGESLLFVFDTTLERQQSPVFLYQRSCPSSPGEYSDNLLKRSSSNIDLVQPKLYNANMTIDTSELDLKMYQDEVEAAVTPLYGSFGKLSLSFLYDKERELLTVTVHAGVNIQSKNNNTSISPYLKVCLLPDKKRRMHSKTRKGDSPVFEEQFVFAVPEYELDKRTLRIAVCDFDRFSRQTVLGYVVVCLSEVTETLLSVNGTGEIWKDLSDNDGLVSINSIF